MAWQGLGGIGGVGWHGREWVEWERLGGMEVVDFIGKAIIHKGSNFERRICN